MRLKVMLLVVLGVLLCIAPLSWADSCLSDCYDDYDMCIDRCGPSSTGSSCERKCEYRYDNCKDDCYEEDEDEKPSIQSGTMSKSTKSDAKKYCYEYDTQIEEYEYKAMQARTKENYCAVIANLHKAIKKMRRPPKECKDNPGWMKVFLVKKQKYTEIIEELKSYCPAYSPSRMSKGSDLKIKKDEGGGISIMQK